MRLSRRFVQTLKLHPEPAYRLAVRAGLHPSLLSKWIHGAERVPANDPRLIAIGLELGLLAEEIFSADSAFSSADPDVGTGGQRAGLRPAAAV